MIALPQDVQSQSAQNQAAQKDGPVPEPQFTRELYDSSFTPALIPASVFAQQLREDLRAQDANLGAEVLHSFKLSPAAAKKTPAQQDEAALQTLLNVRSLEGIPYYSFRRKQYRTFIEKSYPVASAQNKTPLPDIPFADAFGKNAPPKNSSENSTENTASYELSWFRKDSSFGSGVLRYQIFYDKPSGDIYVRMVNLETIRFNDLLPIGGAGDMRLGVLIRRSKDGYDLYAASAASAKSVALKALRRRVSVSLMYRLYAIASWFEKARG